MRGLGICDALQLVVDQSQLQCLRDELNELRLAHEQVLSEATPRAGSRDAALRHSARVDLDHHREELAVLRAIREQVPAEPLSSVSIYGPAPQMSAIIRGATLHSTEVLRDAAGTSLSTLDASAACRLAEAAESARAWTRALVDLVELEWFTFELEA